MALILTADNTVTAVSPDQMDYSLEAMQQYVGGYVEVLRFSDGSRLIVNENGLTEMDPDTDFNDAATAWVLTHEPVLLCRSILGTAVLLMPGEAEAPDGW